ncbi:MAG: membrane protein insertase YidC, partial [Treponema sp.]|nr:membrane protein insertase YidC [Treponema sp.]
MMSLPDLLYTFFIWPVRIILEFLFVLFNRTFHNTGLAVVLLSIVVNTLLLPIYTVADTWQHEERELQKRMKNKLRDIRAVFHGDERQMIINTYYRQMGYSPLSALKGSIGFLLQIPFFIAAYQLLSHTPSLSGESFWILKNLDTADGILRVGAAAFNIMPIIMTAVNIASAFMYTRDTGIREKVQLFGIAAVFLVLLYDSPSGLVLYWTCNNIFSLGKNIAVGTLKKPGQALQLVISILSVILIAGSLWGNLDMDRYRFLFAGIGFCLILAPFAWKALIRMLERRPAPGNALLYFSSLILLCLITGALISSQIMAESAADFAGPGSFIFRTFIQSVAFFMLLGFLIWAFAARAVRDVAAALAAVLTLLALICFFVLSASYGAMTNSFKIEDAQLLLSAFPFWTNPAALAAAFLIPGLFVFFRKQRFLAALFNAVSAALLVMTVVNLVTLYRETKNLEELKSGGAQAEALTGVFPFTSTGNNTFIMFLDRSLGIAMYPALERMPELREQLDGFVWYPNTLSFGGCTLSGVPPMMGGYEYTPLKINERAGELLKDKVNEAVTMLPRLFGETGYRVSITDPSMANFQSVSDISVFRDMKNVTARNLDGRFDRRFREEFPQPEERFIDSFDFDILFRYALFRIALPALRYGLHYKGIWWRDGASNSYGRGVTEYSTLYYLPELCTADTGADTLNIFMNEITHESGAYDRTLLPVPGRIDYSGEEIEFFSSEDNASYAYTFMAAMKAVGRWLEALKSMGVYDNTRIVIV